MDRFPSWFGPIARALALVAFLVTIGEWTSLFAAPAEYLLEHRAESLTKFLHVLLMPYGPIYPESPVNGWLFLIGAVLIAVIGYFIVVGSMRSTVDYLNQSEVPFTVLNIDMKLELWGNDLEHSRVTRTQEFFPNRPRTDAYAFKHQATSERGEIVRGNLDITSRLNNTLITKDRHLYFSKRSLEIIEVFDRHLKTSFFATYLPNGIVHSLYKSGVMFKDVVVRRIAHTCHLNEYNGEDPIYRVTSPNHMAAKVAVQIMFPEHVEIARMTCMRIKDLRVEYLHPEDITTEGKRTFSVEVRNLYRESLELRWSYK
ncbi:hypothetical protein AEAC466_20225 [Asticcacaulis sp. AC466]|uniref:hypothetical protein n=1 Tax=Asticcacaulis sp. AC466 TaxID=1282362 RepID=UPI0003C40FE4|nr:hypothetical protein [Asticcacaulis sp. AC466]ESQ81751.1 hypothetical protein AEAC466_20225 [Asticcacaulis sp. AC466]